MGTIINSIAFENFYNYYGDYSHNEYKFKPGINIINADNNMGKSKFYNGLMWLLRDQVYDSDTKSFTDVKVDTLLKMASGKAKLENDKFKIGVRIVFTNNQAQYTIEKYAYFKRYDGEIIHESSGCDVIEQVDNRDTPIWDKERQRVIIEEVFIPLGLRNYALLQGESMDRLVDLSSRKSLADTIDRLAGTAVLRSICDIAGKMAKRSRSLSNEKANDDENISQKQKEDLRNLEMYEERISRLEEEINNYKAERSAAEQTKREKEAYFQNAQNRTELKSKLDGFDNEIKKQKELIENIETSITGHIFDEQSPWLLMGLEHELDTFDKLRETYIGDLAKMNNAASLVMLPEGSPDNSSLERMLKNQKCEVCGQDAIEHSDAWEHIKRILERPKDVASTRNCFSAFYGNLQKSAGSYSRYISNIESEIETLRTERGERIDDKTGLEYKKQGIWTKFTNAGGTETKSADDARLLKEYSNAVDTITKKDNDIKTAERSLSNLIQAKAEIKKRLENNVCNQELKKYQDFADLMKSIEDILIKTRDDIYDRTIKVLAKKANEMYQDLTSGNKANGGTLYFERNYDGVNVSIRDVQNGEITGLGTGFQRMRQLAIVMAIISSRIGNERTFDYPFISDAPFSEFGENFVNNFFEVAPKVFSQSIIMIKELYDPNSENFLNSFGIKILDRMKKGEINGTFYVNVVEDKADPSRLVTSHKCYFE